MPTRRSSPPPEPQKARPPTKDDIAGIFLDIARLLELKGENPFKLRAYENAALAMESYPGDLVADAREGNLPKIEGIGPAISQKISELLETGRLAYYESLREEFPPDILDLFNLQGLGGKKIKALHDALGIHSISSLARACRDGSVAGLPGFGKKSAENILASIEQHRKHAGSFLLGKVTPLADEILGGLRSLPAVNLAAVAGSFRRRKPVVRDLDFLVSTKNPREAMDWFVGGDWVARVLAHGETKASVVAHAGIQCDLRAVSGAEFPFALLYFTGSKEHNVRLRARAQSMGWTLNEYRLAPAGGDPCPPIPEIHTEEDLQRALGLDPIPPELREDRGEIAAAEQGTLPRLIEWTNLRGTFHNHTTASDGRASLDDMAAAARALGLAYLGIADHSKSSVQANGLDEDRLLAQIEQIREFNASCDGSFRLFAGTECDIRKDGSLDFDDAILARLDYCVISVHSAFGMDETSMTDRIIRAMHNPHATMLGHPTGRLLLSREPCAVNIPAVIDAAAQTGTIIELNANPRRLDLDWSWWPLAREKGVRCSINPDAHSADGLAHLRLGAEVARKGWLTRTDVINTLPLDKIPNALEAKRRASK
jgi:DNA polymerase (family X)